MPTGEVLELWRYPVKSMGGERLLTTRANAYGIGGDRVHVVMGERDGEPRPITAREAAALLAWKANYPFAPNAGLNPEDPPVTQITAPNGNSWGWGDPRLRRALAELVDRPVTLERKVTGFRDVPATVHITTEASRRALEGEMGEQVQIARFRSNIHLALDAAPWEELSWMGSVLRFAGGATIRLTQICTRCVIPTRDPKTQEKWPKLFKSLNDRHDCSFGIYGRVTTGGRIEVGEAAEIVD